MQTNPNTKPVKFYTRDENVPDRPTNSEVAPRQDWLNQSPKETESCDFGQIGFEYHSEYPPEEGQLALPVEERQKEVKAVVTGIIEDMATLACQLPDVRAEIEVPISVMPESCARYGAPVWVSVDTELGYRRIKVAERIDIEPLAPPEDVAELIEWLESED